MPVGLRFRCDRDLFGQEPNRRSREAEHGFDVPFESGLGESVAQGGVWLLHGVTLA